VNHAKKNEIDDEESMLAKYKNEIEELKKELEETKNATHVDQAAVDEAKDMKNQLESMNKLVLVSTQIAAAERKMGNMSKVTAAHLLAPPPPPSPLTPPCRRARSRRTWPT
jgi:hypothetical protein